MCRFRADAQTLAPPKLPGVHTTAAIDACAAAIGAHPSNQVERSFFTPSETLGELRGASSQRGRCFRTCMFPSHNDVVPS